MAGCLFLMFGGSIELEVQILRVRSEYGYIACIMIWLQLCSLDSRSRRNKWKSGLKGLTLRYGIT